MRFDGWEVKSLTGRAWKEDEESSGYESGCCFIFLAQKETF